MSAERARALSALFAEAARRGRPLSTAVDGGYRVKVSPGSRRLLYVWADPHPLRAQILEEIGEDAGLFDPRFVRRACAESPRAWLLGEGLNTPPCPHEWTGVLHGDARTLSLRSHTCGRCGVVASVTHARRGGHAEYAYDGWAVRPHILQAWMTCGPVPGSLRAQAHHGPAPQHPPGAP